MIAAIGNGPNSNINIPLIIFNNKTEAENYFKNLFGEKYDMDKNGFIDLECLGLDELEEDDPILKGLFKDANYYGGCGECVSIELVEIEIGKPITEWDLD